VKNEKHKVYSKSKYGRNRFVVVQNRNIHYVETGEGQPALLIPGAWSTYRYWNRITPLLSKHYRLLALDYLGAGDSDKPGSGFGYTVEEQADLIAGIIEALQVSKVHIIRTHPTLWRPIPTRPANTKSHDNNLIHVLDPIVSVGIFINQSQREAMLLRKCLPIDAIG